MYLGKLRKDFIDLSFYYPVLIYQGEINAVHVVNKDPTTDDDLIIGYLGVKKPGFRSKSAGLSE